MNSSSVTINAPLYAKKNLKEFTPTQIRAKYVSHRDKKPTVPILDPRGARTFSYQLAHIIVHLVVPLSDGHMEACTKEIHSQYWLGKRQA